MINPRRLTLSLAAGLVAASLCGSVHIPLPDASPKRDVSSLRGDFRVSKGSKGAVTPLRLENKEKLPVRKSPAKANSLPVIYGSLLYADWMEDYSPCGYYAFRPQANVELEEICIHPNVVINGGGAYSDSRLHYHLWEMYADQNSETGITFHNYWCVVDTETWSMLNVVDFSDQEDNISYDMTYDPNSNTLYSFQWGPYESDFCDFAKVDLWTGEATPIAKVPQMVCIAADNFGNLYSVGNDGITYYVDGSTGALTPLGESGVTPRYMQSATVDPETNTIYWVAYHANGLSALYTLDTHTGQALKVADMPGNEEFAALFIEAPRKGLDAPGRLVNPLCTSDGGTASFSCTAPAAAFDGSALSGNVTLNMYIDGTLAATQDFAPGAAVTMQAPVADGRHTVVVSASNSKGEGPKSVLSLYTGDDVPAGVGNLTLSINGLQANLTWDVPQNGLNGGRIDPLAVTYTVTRFPGETVVSENQNATNFTETLPAGTATYYYTVKASNELGEGATEMSNAVFMGQAFNVPYYQDFEDDACLDGFTVINSEQGRGWFRWHNTAQNFKAMAHKFTMNDAADSWLILPTINLEANRDYKLKFAARVFNEDDPEKFEVTIGAGATPQSQTRRLLTTQTIKNTKDKIYEIPFKADAEGGWNIGIHCVSAMKSYYLIIDDIEVLDLNSNPVAPSAPEPVANAYSRMDGEDIVITWSAPAKDIDGRAIDPSTLTYNLYDNAGTLLAEKTRELTFTDRRYQGQTSQKLIYYQINAFSGDKVSEPALTDFLLLGKDCELPFGESFSYCQFDHSPWVLSTLKGAPVASWKLSGTSGDSDAVPVGGDNGMAVFVASQLPVGYEGRITSPKVNLAGYENVTATFWVYVPHSKDRLYFEVTHNDHVFTTLAQPDLSEAEGWIEVPVDIPAEHCKAATSFAFHAVANAGYKNICVDNLEVTGDFTGVRTTPDATLKVSALAGNLYISNPTAEDALVYSADGILLFHVKPGRSERVPFRGVALVSHGGATAKYMVK